MSVFKENLVDLDVDKLFEEHTINEIIEIEKLLDAEIERKRIELRAMVGDRYKDILAASDAIKVMKNISEDIVKGIDKIGSDSEKLVNTALVNEQQKITAVDPMVIEERTVIMKMRLVIEVNNQIWMALEEENCCKAAELYLLAQHIHTDLQLLSKDYLDRLPILKRFKSDTDVLKDRILKKAKEKLQAIQLSTRESSSNLNALILLERYQTQSELFDMIIELRKNALSIVINESHASIRVQVPAMLKCLVATVHLLHDCFINYENTKTGLIWQQLESIVGENAQTTLSKVILPETPLIIYIPEIIKEFRPKAYNVKLEFTSTNIPITVQKWLTFTLDAVKRSLGTSLSSVTNIKGLHMIREEALKVGLPSEWEKICNETYLPNNFHVWFYFFQALITERTKALINKKISINLTNLQQSINQTDKDVKSESGEGNLKWYVWKEEDSDVNRTENSHLGLTMKTKGYSPNIVKLCTQFDEKYLELLEGVSLYLYGIEFNSKSQLGMQYNFKNTATDKKHIDKNEIEDYLRIACFNNSQQLTKCLQEFVQSEPNEKDHIIKSLTCARLLQALMNFCHNFKKCCSCGSRNSEWEKICDHFTKSSLEFWQNWIKYCNNEVEISAKELQNIAGLDMLEILLKWENLEIQEQADEKIFKSQIRVPSHPSLYLHGLITKINNQMTAVIPHTLPKQIHLQFIGTNVQILLKNYETAANLDLNQTQALQYLFDVKFITTLSIPRENLQLISKSQSICDKFRSKIDPFDLDVFYSYLQTNVKTCVLQSQVILGCLLPSSAQLASLGMFEKSKELEEPSILAVSVPTTTAWFPLLPITAPVQKVAQTATTPQTSSKSSGSKPSETMKKSNSVTSMRSAAAFFGAMTNDWFS